MSETLGSPPPPSDGCAPGGRAPAGRPGPRFIDGAAARRATIAVARLPSQQLAQLEARPAYGKGLDRAEHHRSDGLLVRVGRAPTQLARRAASSLEASPAGKVIAAGRRLTSARTYRAWIRDVRMRSRSEVVDPFGLDPVFVERWRPLLEMLYRSYFRVEVRGIDNVPDHGRAMIVANHAGALPYDSVMLMYALRYDHPAHRTARPLLENHTFYFPMVGSRLNRLGCVRASQDNAQRLLDDDQLVIVFPEGAKGSAKLYRERYRLQRFGRGGFIKLALRTGTPIIPTAVVGAEEVHPLVARLSWPAKLVDIPYFPVTPTFPWLGPLGAVPMPARWTISFGEALDFSREREGDGGNEGSLVNQFSEQVRSRIQAMVEQVRGT